MARSFAVKSALFVSVVAISAAATGCSNGAPPSDPEDQIAYVQDAIESPSGNVDAISMKGLGSLFTKIQASASIFGALGQITAGGACITGTQQDGTLDLSCSSEGTATGKITFKATADVSSSEVSSLVTATFDNVCNADMSQCVTGTGVVSVEVSTSDGVRTSMAFDATITKDGVAQKVFFGQDASVGGGNVAVKVVLFDDLNDSYVFVANVGSGGVSASVEGGNGSFSCTVGPEGGSCEGDAKFEF